MGEGGQRWLDLVTDRAGMSDIFSVCMCVHAGLGVGVIEYGWMHLLVTPFMRRFC